MKQKDKRVNDRRRKFLGQVVAAGAGTVAAASLPATALHAAEAETTQPEKPQKGYHLSRHILDYYKSAAS